MPTADSPSQSEGDVREEYFESRPTGVELEGEAPLPADEPEPWDPEKIRVHTKHSARVAADPSDGEVAR